MVIDKKQRIMQATESLFRTRQFHELTLEEVARLADVGKGTIYRYFSDKDDLFFQTAVAGFDDMCDLLRQGHGEQLPFRRRLLVACEKISKFFRRRRPLFRMILAEGDRVQGRGVGLRQRWLQRRKKLTQAVAEILRRGMASSEVRSDVPAEIMAEYLLAMLRARAIELADRPESQRSLARLVDLYVNGASGCSVPK